MAGSPIPSGRSAQPLTQAAVEVDRKMLELFVCPQTKQGLHFDEEAQELVSQTAKLAYPVRDGVPILLVSEARTLED